MNVLMIFDQTQAGLGGKEKSHLPLGGKPMAVGSASMISPYLKEVSGTIVACLWCGDSYFTENTSDVKRKVVAMVKKINPDVVICGPCFNYIGYGTMSANLASEICSHTEIPAIACMSQECAQAIQTYQGKIPIVKMPKKGDTGLTQSLRQLCDLADKLVKKQDCSTLCANICYQE